MFWFAVITSMLLVSVVVTLKYVVLPNVESYQSDIISRVAAASGMDVSASAIRGGWSGFRPYVELENVVFREMAGSTSVDRLAGTEALRLPRMTASLSWWALLVKQIRFVDVSLIGPELALSRRKDGLLYFAGRALNAPQDQQDSADLLAVLLEQPGVEIQRATLTWTDDLTPGKTLRFTDVGIRIEKGLNGHVIGITALPPVELAQKLEMRGKMRLQKNAGKWIAVGSFYAAVNDANFAELRSHLPVPDALRAGLGNVRAWIDIDNSAPLSVPTATSAAPAATNPVRAITADISLIDTKAQLSPEVAQLNIARLAGRIEYKAQEDGFTVGSKALALRTREGVTLPPADFSLTLQHQATTGTAKGEITASGIDLKVLTALLEYFPVPKELRSIATRFAPRGVVRRSSFAWTGYLDKITTYRINGAMTDFAINADGSTPGISGFTGTLEGDEKGGKFTVASKSMQLDAPVLLRKPLKFDSFDSDGAWKITAEAVEVDLSRVAFANPEVAGEFSGHYSRFRADGPRAKEEKGPGSLDIKGRLTRASAVAVANYLPNGAAQTREYIEWATRDGEITSADFTLKGEIFEFPYHQGKGGNFRLAAKVKDIDFRYAVGWPAVENVSGELVFENTGFSAKIDSAQFFNAKLKATTIAIDDFAATPYTLSIQGEAAARGEDMTRFLRESPLINGVGAFTRSIAIEGQGRLELALKIPLHIPESVKVTSKISGTYTMKGAQAKPVFGPLITGLNGSVTFTESGVKSNGLAGVAYGNPLNVAITSGNDGVLTEFTGRADVSQLGDLLPFPMPQQVTGTTDINGRITARDGGADIAVESNLLGVTSGLPAPLAKRSDEVRKLRVAFANTGQVSEKISVSLAGNAVASASPASTLSDAPASRIDARFQRDFDAGGNARVRGGIASVGVPLTAAPVPEGLWFAGTIALLDFDSWREAFNKFYPADVTNSPGQPARAATNNGIEIAGFDFRLGGLVAYGRPFEAMTLKGRHGGDDWRLTVDSDDAVGDVSWRAGAFNDRGAVRARLKKLVLADEVPQPKGNTTALVTNVVTREADFPALDIVAEKFTLKDRELGELELRATPMGDNWRIDQLVISTGHAKLEMDGLWQRNSDPQSPAGVAGKSRTTMNMKVESSNLNALFSQFGYGDQLKRGTGKLEGKLSWPGHTYQFETAALSGEFKVEARNGQFAQIPVGAGKLLALISLQSIPRRFTFDFRDVFSEGFAFERIDGNIKINNGIMFTDNFEIVGTAANVKMSGDVSLPTEQTNLKLTVVPSLGEGVAIGAGVVLGPVGGLGVLAVQKLLQGALSYEYAVTGSWDNPQVDRIKNDGQLAKPANAPATPTVPVANAKKSS
ncbi:MAG: TIGR02099 family protein [Burkholderiales bacterium]|nr:TIGR02099 family protein [Burkholderiales bacterium]